MGTSGSGARWLFALLTAAVVAAGCHGSVELKPLIDRKVYLTDKFYDVEPLTPEHVFVVGYGGKILETRDGGRSWDLRPSGTDKALFDVLFVDEKNGWIVGQEGLILHSTDGGQTWAKQESGTDHYLFAIAAASTERLVAVGEASTIAASEDGGQTWEVRHQKAAGENLTEEERMVLQDPSFYDVVFLDERTGFIAGEFGHILKTTDGGRGWSERQGSLVGGEVLSALDLPTFYGLSFESPRVGIATGLSGHIARTTDGGETWSFDEIAAAHRSKPFFSGSLLADGSGWAVGAAGDVIRRAAGDEGWRAADLGMQVHSWLRKIVFADAKNGWIVGGFGTILYTRDGGETWIPTSA